MIEAARGLFLLWPSEQKTLSRCVCIAQEKSGKTLWISAQAYIPWPVAVLPQGASGEVPLVESKTSQTLKRKALRMFGH
ncbi:hypothetical protein GCM10010525_30340 [Glutamicibacter bergerei]